MIEWKYGITPADMIHAPVLAAIHRASFPEGESWGADAIGLQLRFPRVFALFHPAGGMILARCAVDQAEVLTMGVLPGLRARGLGTALLTAGMEKAASLGAREIFLEVSARNRAAHALYIKCKFTETGRRPGYYRGGVDALVLRAQLPPPPSPHDDG